MLSATRGGLLLVAVLTFVVAAAQADEAPQPNIVFLLADDLGSHDVGWRGSEIKTPHLDRLARGGAQLDQFYVQPVCSPTRAALLTGRYPFRYGLQTGVVRPWAEYGLSLDERLLPEALKEAGYSTAIVGKWHLGHFDRKYLPTQRGFDHQYGHYNGALDYYTHERDGGFDWHRDDRVNRDEGYATELLAKEAVQRIRERDRQRPLFLYVPFNAVHSPLQVPPRYEEPYTQFKGKRRTYAGMVTALDEAVGQIVAALEDEKLLRETLIIFSSDNGGPAPGRITSNGALRDAKGTVYEGGVRVCAFATWEGKIKPETIVNAPLHIVDWYPTLLKLAGAKTEQKLPVDGHDIWPVLTQGASSTHETLLINAAPDGGAIRVGDWKLVVSGLNAHAAAAQSKAAKSKAGKPGRQRAGEQSELFNLADDPGEQKNLAQAEPTKLKELRTRYDALAAQAVPPKSVPQAKNFRVPKVWGEPD